jgi:hypothetical protein
LSTSAACRMVGVAACGCHGRLHALLTAGRLTGHAVNASVSVVDFANGGRACPAGVTHRHEQPVADIQLIVK